MIHLRCWLDQISVELDLGFNGQLCMNAVSRQVFKQARARDDFSLFLINLLNVDFWSEHQQAKSRPDRVGGVRTAIPSHHSGARGVAWRPIVLRNEKRRARTAHQIAQ